MDQGAEYNRAVSLHLSRTLDEIGLNTLTVKKRRHAALYREQMDSVYNRLTGKQLRTYHFGSQTEGTTTPGMHSDLDHLHCTYFVNVIEDWVDWKQGQLNLLMLQENTTPGYCRLQLLRSDVPMAQKKVFYLPRQFELTYDTSGRVIVKNTLVHSNICGLNAMDRSGPASSHSCGPSTVDEDHVYAFPCNKWPRQATEFIRRHRRHGWPSQRLLKEAVSNGVFLVPVGYKLSPSEHLEWRISASLAERCLMFSLHIVHIKCYVVLKILVKTFIAPRIQNCISSYHCKTALLYCIETTESDFWHEDNLLQCIERCLKVLRYWVFDMFCPQFILSRENLFAGKVHIHNRDILLSILTELISNGERVLLQVQMDDLGHRLHTKLNTEPSRLPIHDSWVSVFLIGSFEMEQHRMIAFTLQNYLIWKENERQLSLIPSVYQDICTLKEQVQRATKHERLALQTIITLLSCWLGSLLASLSLSRKKSIPRQAIELMNIAVKYDVASMLKLASVFYCSGKFAKVETMLLAVEDQLQRNDFSIMCRCYNKRVLVLRPQKCNQMMFVLKGKKTRAKLVAHCVKFSHHERHCAPSALHHEMHRSIGDDIQHRDPYDCWMVLAAVDCLPYLYYLQYLTYKQLGKNDLQRRSLNKLDRCVREDNDFSHLETAWNLLGQCLEDAQDPDAAMACYRASLAIRPRNNAANWRVAVLWYKMLKFFSLLPGGT